MGGKISLESELGQGTRIGFEFDIEICKSASLEQADLDPVPATINGVRVLMVEDDATNSMVTRSYLQHLGHHVTAAQSGEEALMLLDEGNFSLVLLDISLPGIDGLTILKHIRAHAEKTIAEMPVIAMSAHVFTEEVDQYLSAGMDGFLGKPFSLEDLEHAIAQAIRGGEIVIAKNDRSRDQGSVKQFDTSMIDDDISRLGLENVEQLAGLFFQSADQLKSELVEAMNASQFEKLEKLAHKLNGAAGNFGLERLCALLGRIETQAVNGTEITSGLHEQFELEYEDAIAVLGSYLSQQKNTTSKMSVSQ
jgi:two-component system sensor histidine kinase TorS